MAKFNDIRELAQQNARWVSNSPKDWMNYLDVAARLYRYSFKDTLLIHAQRPDATACAELEVWNKKMNRWVNRGAKGIALLDDASPRAKLRYVFDIADTHLVQGGRTPILWRIDDSEHQQMILDHLADTYALTQTDSMNAALMELAQQLTAENLEEAMDGLEYEVTDTFLEGLDEDNLRVRFRELMTNSIFYTLSRRCEQEPLEMLDDEDFIRIVDFNQLPVLTFLGNAVSEQCEAVLRDIGREMQKIYRKEVTEHLAKTADSLYNTSTDFNTLKRETETNITEGGKPYGTDLSPQGGLPVSEPDRTGRADEHWEVRDAAQDLSEGKQEELVSEYADERQAESASGADRRAGGEPDGRTDREPEREVSGSEQGNRTDGMGGTSEQSDRDGGRDRAEGIGVQLTADTTEQDLSEAEEEIASAFSLPSLPTVEQQIRTIEAPMQAQYADEITIPAEVVDEILRTGSNRSKSQLRLIYNFMTEQTPEEYTAFVKKEYGEGGKGFEIGGTKYAVWFDELGMQIAVGDTVRNDPKNKAFLSWRDVSGRIHQLLQQGEYLGHFDSWAASFGETVTAIELSPEGTGYRAKTRFARFFNLPELISLFKESADVQTADMLNLPVPEAEYINEVLKPSETQQEMVSSFADRAERVRNGNVDPRTDNMLKITNDGRKLALDQRLINDLLPDEPESKVNLCVENAYQVWEESTPDKSTQLIFCDLSTPKADGTFNVYDDVREKLVAKGIPREEIAFIHEANTETKKAELFAKVRSGQVRILLGSTPKLGAGTNIQDRLIALHHLDCPWKPSDLEQQEGRILRQGNRNQKVKIFRYVTENTFDSYMWQILENKQKFISQIMTSKSPVRACDDVDDTALTYAEIKALATGNPYIKEKMDLDIQVSKLKLMRANHTSQIYSLESDIARRYPAEITAAKERIAGLKTDLAVAKPLLEQDKEKFSITVEDRVYTDRKEAGSAILAACAAMKIAKTEGQIADLGGFAISSRFDAFAQTFKLTIKRQSSYTIELGSDPAGNIQRILNVLASIEKTLPQVERRLETLQQQLAEAKEEVQRPFPQEAELNEKSARLAELNALLDMDEKGDDAALGMDEEVTDSELPAPKREIERSADSVKRPSILAQLHEKQAERMAEPKTQKKKSHDMEL